MVVHKSNSGKPGVGHSSTAYRSLFACMGKWLIRLPVKEKIVGPNPTTSAMSMGHENQLTSLKYKPTVTEGNRPQC